MRSRIYDCPQCGKLIGRLVTIEKIELLLIDGLYVRELRGHCRNCGNEVRFSISSRFIQALIEKSKIR
jgi:hypothetical protein